MVRSARTLARLPVARRLFDTIDDLRDERDRLRRERDGLRRECVRLQERLDGTAERHGRSEADEAERERLILAFGRQPSFLARTETLRRVRRAAIRMHGQPDPVWEFNDKRSGAALATRLGLATPQMLIPPMPLDQLEPPRRRCLVKPVTGASARGVVPLVPQPGGLWLDLFEPERGPCTWEEIRAQLAEVVATRKVSDSFFVEQLIEGPTPLALPYDWKLLCVGGQVVVAYGRHGRNRREPRAARFRYFSRDWQDLGPVHNAQRLDPEIPLPNHPEELVRAAESVARALPTAFVRVDLYDPPDRVVFGEITPQPGNVLWFGAELDRSIGELWDHAEAASWARDD